MSANADAEFVAVQEQISCDLSGEAVILNLRTGMYYGLNPVGARIWELLQTPRTILKVSDTIAAEYSADPSVCERDVRSLIDRLTSVQLVRVAGSAI